MAFKLNTDQTALRETLRDFLTESITSEYRRSRAEGDLESDPKLWRGFQELGLFELFGADGGTGVAELALVAQELGRAVAPEALVDALVAGPYLLNHFLTEDMRGSVRAHFGEDFVVGVSGGDLRVGFALDGANPAASLTECRSGEIVRLDGTVQLVSAPGDLDGLIVRGHTGLLLCDLRASQEQQVVLTRRALMDGTIKAGDLELRNVRALQLGACATFLAVVRVLRAAEMSGAVARAIEMTVDYVKTRQQFGVPVGGFQAVQHRLADMHANGEALRALVAFAAWSADRSPDQLSLASPAALRFACDVSAEIVEGAIQLHGGIGFTWEYDLHYFLRRVKALQALWQPSGTDYIELIEAARLG